MTSTTEVWKIRPASRADTAALADIYLTVRTATFSWVDPNRFRRSDFSVHSRGERIFVCGSAGGEIAGFLALWEPENFIHMLYIRQEFQGLGAGTALLNALPGWPTRRYRLKCLTRNRRACAFYLTHGFDIVGSGSSPEGEYHDLVLGSVESGSS